jgi:hypothetical protein
MERVELIEDLDVRGFCAQGIVDAGGIIRTFTASFPQADCRPIMRAGSTLAIGSFSRSRYWGACFEASLSRLSGKHSLPLHSHRVAISNHRLVSFVDGQVTFGWRDSANKNKQLRMTLPVELAGITYSKIVPSGQRLRAGLGEKSDTVAVSPDRGCSDQAGAGS